MILNALESGKVLFATDILAQQQKTDVGAVYAHGLGIDDKKRLTPLSILSLPCFDWKVTCLFCVDHCKDAFQKDKNVPVLSKKEGPTFSSVFVVSPDYDKPFLLSSKFAAAKATREKRIKEIVQEEEKKK